MASIYQRNRWWHIEYIDRHGRRQQYSLRTTDKKSAQFEKNRIENELLLERSPLPDSRKKPLEILDEYIAFCRHRNKKRTISDDDSRIRRFIKSAGIRRLADISERDVHAHTARLLNDEKRPVTPRTANAVIASLKTFLNFCVRSRYLGENPLVRIRMYPAEKKPPVFLSKDEIRALEACARPEIIFPMVMTAVYTGMRYSELLALRREDVDIARESITVHAGKTKKFRAVPLHPELKNILAGLPAGQCFPFPNIRRTWKRVRKNAALQLAASAAGKAHGRMTPAETRAALRDSKLANAGWHTLRHTFASHLVMSGVDLVTVSKLLGHSTIQTTMIYAHLSDAHVAAAVVRLKFT